MSRNVNSTEEKKNQELFELINRSIDLNVILKNQELMNIIQKNNVSSEIEDARGRNSLHMLLDRNELPLESLALVNLEELESLIKGNVDVNKLDNYGNPPIVYAAYLDNRLEAIQLLVENGAKVDEELLEKIMQILEYCQVGDISLSESICEAILNSAIIVTKLFEKNGIEKISEELKYHLKEELKFVIKVCDENTIFEFPLNSYKKSFQSQLFIALKKAVSEETKDFTDLYHIVNDNLAKLEKLNSFYEISFEKMYQGSILDHYSINGNSCTDNDESTVIGIGQLNSEEI